MFTLLLDVGRRNSVVALIVLVVYCLLLGRAESSSCRRALALVEGVRIVRDVVARSTHGCLHLARRAR